MTGVATDLIALLDAERKAITTGAFDTLSDLGASRESLVPRLQSESVDADLLARISSMAARNMRLMDAALRGLKVATDRIAALRAVQRQFDTYGADGQRQVHDHSRPAFEHKA